MTTNSRRLALMIAIILVVVTLDQVTKLLAQSLLPPHTVTLLGGIVRLGLSENVGGFLGLGATLSPELRFWLLLVASAGLLFGVVAWIIMTPNLPRSAFIALSCVAGGGLGNLLDRAFRGGRVVDFLNFGIGRLRTGILNVADIAITFGALYVIWVGLRQDIGEEDTSD